MNRDEITKEKTCMGVIGPPKKYAVPLPEDHLTRCVGCPYPGVGFICWSTDGSCMKTDINRIHHQKKGG
jgi:hypothetical protein